MHRALVAGITSACAAALAGATVMAAQAGPPAPVQRAPVHLASAQRASVQHASAQRASAQRASAQHALLQRAARQRSRRERFRIVATSLTASRLSVLATGSFTAGGHDVPGRVRHLRATDKMVFPSGSFLMARHITRQWLPLPTRACLVRETLRGRYSLGHGTGAYARISGTGWFVVRIRGVIRSSHGKCGGRMTVVQSITYTGGKIRR